MYVLFASCTDHFLDSEFCFSFAVLDLSQSEDAEQIAAYKLYAEVGKQCVAVNLGTNCIIGV